MRGGLTAGRSVPLRSARLAPDAVISLIVLPIGVVPRSGGRSTMRATMLSASTPKVISSAPTQASCTQSSNAEPAY